jgi:hypothetical protein
MAEAPLKLVYYFGKLGMNGKFTQTKAIFESDLLKAEIPIGTIVTWTLDGSSVLTQSKNGVYMFNFRTMKKAGFAKAIEVLAVHGWVDNNHLLVKYKNVSELASNGQQSQSDIVHWGVITLVKTSDSVKK